MTATDTESFFALLFGFFFSPFGIAIFMMLVISCLGLLAIAIQPYLDTRRDTNPFTR